MNKNDFLNNLTHALAGLPQEEIKKTIDYYSEMIDDAVEDGRDEEKVVAGLENVEDIAEKVINETPLRKFVKEDVKSYNMSAAVIVLLIVGSPVWLPILTAFFSVILSLYLVIWSIVASLFIVFASLAAAGAGMLIMSPFLLPVRPLKAMFAFGSGILCAGLAVLMFYLSVWCAKMTVKLTVLIGRKIKGIFIKKGSELK